jgi:hypothetical protein
LRTSSLCEVRIVGAKISIEQQLVDGFFFLTAE